MSQSAVGQAFEFSAVFYLTCSLKKPSERVALNRLPGGKKPWMRLTVLARLPVLCFFFSCASICPRIQTVVCQVTSFNELDLDAEFYIKCYQENHLHSACF